MTHLRLGTVKTSTFENEEQQNENNEDDDPLMRSLEVEADNEVDTIEQERSSSSNNNEEADAAHAKASAEIVGESATTDGDNDRVALDFQKSDVDGDGFLNQEEFTSWAAQRPDNGNSTKFDAVSFVDLCDENGCDDLKVCVCVCARRVGGCVISTDFFFYFFVVACGARGFR